MLKGSKEQENFFFLYVSGGGELLNYKALQILI